MTPADVESRLRVAVSIWSGIIFILDNRWQIDCEFVHDNDDWPDENDEECAFITTYRGYCSAKIVFNCARIKESEIDHVVSHELTHAICRNLESAVDGALGEQQSELARSVCEETVDQLSRALVAAKLYGERSAKRKRKK